jgi:hypothetical protein
MKRRTGVGALIVAAAGILGVAGAASPASAHSGFQSYVYLNITEDSLGGRIEMPLGDLSDTLGLDLAGTDDEIVSELEANAEVIGDYVDEHLSIGVDGAVWPLDYDTPTLFFSEADEADDRYAIVEFDADLGGAEMPRVFDVTFDAFLEQEGAGDNLLLIQNDWAGGVIDNGHEVLVAFTANSPTHTIDLGEASWTNTVTESMRLGVDHIRTGPDHILFVLVLLLPSVLVFNLVWRPAKDFGASLWRITKIVSMFTLAHTITFTLAGLDVLPLPPSKLTESVIAISIAAAALHNLKPVALNKEWLIAFVFGLFHGMGFAGLVDGLDVSQGTKLLSLIGRNIGIEIGQTVVVLVAFPLLFLLRRTRYYMPFFKVASVGLAVVSIGWMIERIFEVDLKISQAIEPMVQWPRSLVVMAILTVVAAAIREVEARAGRLLPLDQSFEPSAKEEAEPVPV